MKLVVIPGVGFQTAKSTYEDFCSYLRNGLQCETEMYYWQHDWPIPEIKLPYYDIRKWGYECILDFQQVILHAFEMKVPPADYYLGHSAGSIIALAQKDVSCVIFGSPAVLVECVHKSINAADDFNNKIMESVKSKKNILNIINKYDQLAYYLDLSNVENYVFRFPWYLPKSYEPIECHDGYWESKETRQKIVNTIKNWEAKKNS